MPRKYRKHLIGLLAALLMLLSGCAGEIPTVITGMDGSDVLLDYKMLVEQTVPESEQRPDDKQVLLERVLADLDYVVIDTLDVVGADGKMHSYLWADIARDTWLARNGELTINGTIVKAAHITPHGDARMADVVQHLINIAPTAAQALGIDAPQEAQGTTWDVGQHPHVALIFLDAFGYMRYEEARDAGLIPVLSSLPEPVLATCAYPPATVISSAAVLTGAMPQVSGVRERSTRKTETETLLDVASAAGLSVVAIEGEALAFNMRNADLTLSGDRDQNGTSDDNVRTNALSAIEAGMPDLLWIHFHGIDDFGHTYGPQTPEESARISDVDRAVGDILDALPADTLAIIFADHGMHAVEEEGRLGNHGHLIPRDMYVPIFTVITE